MDRLDEEKIYIYLMRFIFIYNQMLKVSGDENFVRLRFGDEVNMAQMQIKIYEQGLMKRYEDKKKREASTDSDSDSDSLKPFQITVFDTSGKIYWYLLRRNF